MTTHERQYLLALEQIAEVKRHLGAVEHALTTPLPATLLVTSAVQGEGKSLFAASLSTIAAKSGRYRVALFDLNWYRPSLNKLFDLPLTNSVNKIISSDIHDLITHTSINALDIVTAPTDYIHHSVSNDEIIRATTGLVAQAKKSHELVILDTSAIFPTNRLMIDPVILSGIADGVVMVILSSVTPRQHVKRAQKTLETAGARILGIISNQGQLASKR